MERPVSDTETIRMLTKNWHDPDFIFRVIRKARISSLIDGLLIGGGLAFLIGTYLVYNTYADYARDIGEEIPYTGYFDMMGGIGIAVIVLLVIGIIHTVWTIASSR